MSRYDLPETGDEVDGMEGWHYTGDEWWAIEPESQMHLWISPLRRDQESEPSSAPSSSMSNDLEQERVSNTWRVNEQTKSIAKSDRTTCKDSRHLLLCGHQIRTQSVSLCGENCVYPNVTPVTERAFCCPTCVEEIVGEKFLRECAGNMNEEEYQDFKQYMLENENIAESLCGAAELDMLFSKLRQCEAVSSEETEAEEVRGRSPQTNSDTTFARDHDIVNTGRPAWWPRDNQHSASPLEDSDTETKVNLKEKYGQHSLQKEGRGLGDSMCAGRQNVEHPRPSMDFEVLMDNFAGICVDELAEQLRERFRNVVIG